jgi:hypothetical protein
MFSALFAMATSYTHKKSPAILGLLVKVDIKYLGVILVRKILRHAS